MSSWCEWCLNFNGTEEDMQKVLKLLNIVEGIDLENEKQKIFPCFERNGNQISATNIRARKIWGDHYLQPDADLYITLAQEVPNASFSVLSNRTYEGGGSGCESYLDVVYNDGKLRFRRLCFVDTYCISSLIQMMLDNCGEQEDCTDLKIATTGKLSLFEDREDLQCHIEELGGIYVSGVSKNTDYLVTNFPDSTTAKVKKAKELGIPIISELEFIQKFSDIYEFDLDDSPEALSAITYEQFCDFFEVDDDLTEEVFNNCKQDQYSEGFYVYDEHYVSVNGDWEEMVFILEPDGTIRNEDGSIDATAMKNVKDFKQRI